MSEDDPQGLNIKCRAEGCEREAVVRWKGLPLCAPHYEERMVQRTQSEPVRTRAGELEPGYNRHI